MTRLERYWRRNSRTNPRKRLGWVFMTVCRMQRTLDLIEGVCVSLDELRL